MIRALLLSFALLTVTNSAHAETIAIVGGTVHTSIGAPIEGGIVVITDGRIVAVGRSVTIPPEARRVDATGLIVTTGLMASKTTLGLVEVNAVEATDDSTVGEAPFGAAFDVRYGLNADSTLLPHVRADGLTRAISAPGHPDRLAFSGMAAVIRLVDGPMILDRAGVAMVVHIGGRTPPGGSRAAQWLYVREALDEARAFSTGRADTDQRDPLLGRADVRALQPVIEGRMPLAVAVSRAADIRQAVALATDYKIRVVILGGEEAWRVATELATRKIPVVLDPSLDQLTDYETIGARAENAALLHRAGVMIAFMSETSRGSWDAGVALREGGGYAVAAGLPREAALAAMTINPARIWGIDDHYGAITPGRDADLVIWDGDPLQVTTAPVAVFVRGREVSLVTRQQLLRQRYGVLPAGRPEPSRDNGETS